MRKAWVYKITSPSGKVYVGSTINLVRRISEYKRSHSKKQYKIFRSIKKYGYENHRLEILSQCTTADILKQEAYYGILYNVLSDNGLNLQIPKHGAEFAAISEETRAKMSRAQKGKVISEGVRNTLRKLRTGTKLSDSTKNKIGLASMGHKHNLGKKHSVETKNKMSIDRLGNNNGSFLVLNKLTGIYYYSLKQAALSTKYCYDHFKDLFKAGNTNFIRC